MATDLCEGTFQPSFAKTTENGKALTPVSFRIIVKAVQLLGQILRVMYFSEK